MTSSRPYLVRALYEWIVDNERTPHLLVNAEHPGVQVPAGFANDGQIVLNVAPGAVRNLQMNNDAVSFEGRFGGVPHSLHLPSAAIMAIYARENGQGMVFEIEPTPPDDDAPDDGSADDSAKAGARPASARRPSLKVVK